jgi:DMSO reductase family type II enzyme heme b subunit
VEIAYWRASWEAWAGGRPDDIHSLYPNTATPHYPPEAASLEPGSPEQVAMADRYNPARALDNRMEGPRDRTVQDLLAEGPGTLHPAPVQRSTGSGRRSGEGWQVVLARPIPRGLQAGGRTQVALAVWQGDHGEVGARKMRSAWIPLSVEAR